MKFEHWIVFAWYDVVCSLAADAFALKFKFSVKLNQLTSIIAAIFTYSRYYLRLLNKHFVLCVHVHVCTARVYYSVWLVSQSYVRLCLTAPDKKSILMSKCLKQRTHAYTHTHSTIVYCSLYFGCISRQFILCMKHQRA